ncbi:MAG: hypothetical protein K1X94_08810 [Sandaracinaceae bacterium]|nr:hypothetical protein [Sandaracinaceae bacterium]
MATLLLVAIAALPAACDEAQRSAMGTCCLGCGLVGWAIGESTVEQATEEGPRCTPACDEPRFCNTLYEPPRCTEPVATRGERCGRVSYPRAEYECIEGVCSTRLGRDLSCTAGLACVEGTCVSAP